MANASFSFPLQSVNCCQNHISVCWIYGYQLLRIPLQFFDFKRSWGCISYKQTLYAVK